MINRKIVKCEYCGTNILMRFQIGSFDIPFDIVCPQCKVHISGEYKISDNHSFTVKNANDIDSSTDNIDYFSDFSIEFPNRKTKKYESLKSLVDSGFSPFMRAMQIYGNFEQYDKIAECMRNFITFRNSIWVELSAMYDLFFNDKIEHIKCRLDKFSKAYDTQNKFDAAMGLHQILICSFSSVLPNSTLKEYMEYANKIIPNISSENLIELLNKLGRKNYFESNGKRLIKIISRWCNDFEKYIPVIMMCLGKTEDKFSREEYGIATTSFESIKSFYSDSYELILDMLDIAVGLNNIIVRGNIDIFKENANCKSFDDYRKLTKSLKLEKFISDEPFSNPITLNRTVRNSIAHFSYDIDVDTQKIVFLNNHKGKETVENLYLLDLAILCYDNMKILMYLNELMYTLRKIDYIDEGYTIHIKKEYY